MSVLKIEFLLTMLSYFKEEATLEDLFFMGSMFNPYVMMYVYKMTSLIGLAWHMVWCIQYWKLVLK